MVHMHSKQIFDKETKTSLMRWENKNDYNQACSNLFIEYFINQIKWKYNKNQKIER